MKFILNFFKGLAIGIGAIAPGVSGGALAVIFGVYEKLNEAIATIFSDFRRKVIFLLPFALGGGLGVLAFSNIMKYLFAYHDVEMKYLFIGFMLGTLPSLIKEANKQGFKKKYILPVIITFSITVIFSMLENNTVSMGPEGTPTIVDLIFYGALIGFGTIVPGISASFILMYIGAYEILLDAIASLNLVLLIPAGLGFVLSIMIFAKVISLLFHKAYGYTYYAILGFVIGSIIPIYPGIGFSLKYVISLALFAVGFSSSYYLSSTAKRSRNNN